MRRRAAAPVPPIAEREKPGLSLTLAGPRDPRLCQSCGVPHHPGNPLARWLEADSRDAFTVASRVVVLCRRCSDRTIEPHARLYEPLPNGAAFAGCMSVCIRCNHRSGVRCESPELKSNGGPGLKVAWEHEPLAAFVDYAGGGALTRFYSGPVVDCSGRRA